MLVLFEMECIKWSIVRPNLIIIILNESKIIFNHMVFILDTRMLVIKIIQTLLLSKLKDDYRQSVRLLSEL